MILNHVLTIAALLLMAPGTTARKGSSASEGLSAGNGSPTTSATSSEASGSTSDGSSSGTFDKPLDFMCELAKSSSYSTQALQSAWGQVQNGGITALVSFCLNEPDPQGKFGGIINLAKSMNMIMVPAVGYGKQQPINGNNVKGFVDAIASAGFTDYIRIEIGGTSDEGAINDIINYCAAKFDHIMMNPWPRVSGGYMEISEPKVDSAYINVLPNEGSDDTASATGSGNWLPGNVDMIDFVNKRNSDTQILINYESAPQQDALAKLGASGSEAAMNQTISAIDATSGDYTNKNLHWIPPMDLAYDPLSNNLNTWDWIAQQLSAGKGQQS